MHVLYADSQSGILRMSGAQRPLEGWALNGTLTITLVKTVSGTRIDFEYVFGGYMQEIAPAVDVMLGQQLAGLADGIIAAPQGYSGTPG